jgi:exopolysaccharide production protein ExoY
MGVWRSEDRAAFSTNIASGLFDLDTAGSGDAGNASSVLDAYEFRSGIVRLAPDMEISLKMPRVRYRFKRIMDLVIGAVALILMLPVFLVIAIAIKVTSPGPVLFHQKRVGRNGQSFEVLKFRTMDAGASKQLQDDVDLAQAYQNNDYKVPPDLDHRITKLGRFLRRTSVDEVPQFINVFLGHMSLVGPRPVVPDELGRYGPLAPAYLAVRPGITGAWQVGGRSAVNYPERAVIDLMYVLRWGLLVDLAILLRTIPVVIGRKGAY